MVDFVVFFDFSTFRPGGKGIDGRFHLIFPTFRLFDLGGGSKQAILIFFDFSTWARGSKRWILLNFFDFVEFFRLFDLGEKV